MLLCTACAQPASPAGRPEAAANRSAAHEPVQPTPTATPPGLLPQVPATTPARPPVLEPSRRSASPSTRAATSRREEVSQWEPTLDVARAYVRTRLTYRYDDPASLSTAATASRYSTRALAARMRPAPAALARLRTAQEVSLVDRLLARPAPEAPSSTQERYVQVDFSHTITYRGGANTAPARWTVRLLRRVGDRWRVDGVLSTG